LIQLTVDSDYADALVNVAAAGGAVNAFLIARLVTRRASFFFRKRP
jgi:uncharacterized protein YbjT (DUF2867 family)